MFYRVVLLVQDGVGINPDAGQGQRGMPQDFEVVRQQIRMELQVDDNGRYGDDSYVIEIDPMPIPNEVAIAQKNIVFPPRQPRAPLPAIPGDQDGFDLEGDDDVADW